MSLELRSTTRRFYSRLMVNGKRKLFPLKTNYEGTPPPMLRMRLKGDAEFERSRGRAEQEENLLREELRNAHSEVQLRKKVYEAATDKKFQTVRIKDLYNHSANFIRRRPWSDRHAQQVKAKLENFITWLNNEHPQKQQAHQITRPIAEAFLIHYQQTSHCGAKTVNEVKTMLQGLWTVAIKLGLLQDNPFRGIAKQHYISTNKEIFTAEQIVKILKEAQKDPDLHTVIVVALSTGMRLADCCSLEWSSVSINERLVSVPAQKKNMRPARIPYFGLLEQIILQAKAESACDKYVFPRAHSLYQYDPQYFSRAFSALLLRIGFTNDDNPETSIRLMGTDGGCRRRPLRSFHGLRTTWMTMALNGGVSMEDVKKICGSVDTETILTHYFHSDSERIRSKLHATMPAALGGQGEAKNETAQAATKLIMLLDQMNADNWESIRQQLRESVSVLKSAS